MTSSVAPNDTALICGRVMEQSVMAWAGVIAFRLWQPDGERTNRTTGLVVSALGPSRMLKHVARDCRGCRYTFSKVPLELRP